MLLPGSAHGRQGALPARPQHLTHPHSPSPTPLQLVINEYGNFTVANFTENDSVFQRPDDVPCENTTIADAFEAVAFHAPHMLPEVLMAARSHGLI